MHEKYLDALYRFEELLAEDFAAFTEDTERKGLDGGRIKYADCMMHLAKNLRKEIFAEEGMSPEEIEGMSGNTQGYGRAIRTTPGMTGNGQSGNGQSGNRSMRGGSYRSGKSAYSGDDGWSGEGNTGGRNSSSGADENGFYNKMKKMADMTADHDEREMILRMIERMKHENK